MLKRALSRMSVVVAVSGLSLVVACGDTGTSGTSTSSGGTDGGQTTSGGPTCTSTGVVVPDPTTDAVIQGGGTPDFSCYTTPVMLTAPATVVAKGCVDIFGLGNRVKQGMKLAVYGADQNPAAVEDGGDVPRYGEHDITLDVASSCDSRGTYRVTGLPSNTKLLFKTRDTDTGANKTAVDTYQYNVFLRADRHDPDGDGEFEFAANMIFVQTYTTIPSLVARPVEGQSNLSDGLGRGVIAGEVRDCQERSVGGVVVAGSCVEQVARLVYFNGAADPQPVITRTNTNSDGLYSAVNVKSLTTAANGTTSKGFLHEIEAKVKTPNGILSAGKAQIYVYPDSVSIFSPQGLLPTVP